MQSKGLITTVASILIVVCAYQLLFTWKVNKVEKKAETVAISKYEAHQTEEIRLAKNLYLDSLSEETVFNLGFKKFTYAECKKNQLNLGLDLQGGMSVVLQVQLEDFLKSLSGYNEDAAFNLALEKATEEHNKTGADYIALFIKHLKEVSPKGDDVRFAPIFNTRDNQEEIPFDLSNEETEKIIREKATRAVNTAYNMISARIDQFGVTQPNIQLEEKRGRIIVELAGVDNPARVRGLLQSTANLEFWLMYKTAEVGNYIIQAEQIIKDEIALEEALNDEIDSTLINNTVDEVADLVDETEDIVDESIDEVIDEVEEGLDNLAALEEDSILDEFDDLEEDSSELDLTPEEIKKEYPIRSIFQINIDSENRYVDGPAIGYAQIKDTALLNSYFNNPKVQEIIPEQMKFRWGYKHIEGAKSLIYLYAIKTSRGNEEPVLNGSVVKNAKKDIDQSGMNVVSMDMNNEGSKIWCEVTGDNVDNHIGIVVDNGVVSAPVINDKICGGSTQISGSFTIEEAQDLANMLEIGELPAKVEIVEEEVVGPTLGKDNIKNGLLSLLAGLLIVVGFMIIYYSGAGLVAVSVLLLNLFLIIGVLASLGATLTLPGIAGLVLTIGMAVDANVIIFERIREELAKGKALRVAISDGYKYSTSAILDANVTTLLTAFILFSVGKGPVKGFAAILIIGIFSSLFTAVLVARVMIESYLGKKKDSTIGFSTGFSKGRFKDLAFDFLGKRKMAYMVSGFLVLAGLASIFTRGFDFGVDFQGGREYKIEFAEAVNTSVIKDKLDNAAYFDGGTVVKSFGSDKKIKVTTSHMINVPGTEADTEVERKLFNGLREYLPSTTEVSDEDAFTTFKETNLLSSTEINPIISVDFKRSAIWATVLSILAIFLYILIRFSTYNRGGRVKWEYAVGAVVTIAHDVLVVLGIFSIFKGLLPFSLEIDQPFIAALLTVIGYSLNDTVVVFDRIREYLGLFPKKDKGEVINKAVNDTLSRTLITSITTLFVVGILFVFGGSVIQGFAFALLIGILVGTYSSVFVATPIMYEISKNQDVKKVPVRTSKANKRGKKVKA